MPLHRKILLWIVLAVVPFCALQVGWRLWLLSAGDSVVGEVTVAADSCRTRHRANCFLGRAIVNPRMDTHKLKVSKIPGGRFYSIGETVEMRVYPAERLYLAAVYTPINWLLGPVRTCDRVAAAVLKALWIPPIVIAIFLTMG